MSAPPEGLSVVVPAFNEEATLAASVAEMLASAGTLGVPFEVVVVDDGSTDGTAHVATELSARDGRVRLVRRPVNGRIGAALRTGIANARFPRVVLDPVDSPLEPAEFRRLYDGCGDADVAVGYRAGRAGYPAWLRGASTAYRWLLRAALGVGLRDYNWCCGYRREIFRTLPIRFDGIVGLPEVLARAHRAGLRLVEVPVGMRPRTVGKGTVRRIRTWTKVAADVARLAVDLRIGGSRRAPVLAAERAS